MSWWCTCPVHFQYTTSFLSTYPHSSPAWLSPEHCQFTGLFHPGYTVGFSEVDPPGTLCLHIPGTPQVSRSRFPALRTPVGHRKCPIMFFSTAPPHYTMGFPDRFSTVSRAGTPLVFPRCDRSVTGAPITVSWFGTPQWHWWCTHWGQYPVFRSGTLKVHCKYTFSVLVVS